jgi:hypothetical protein
MNGFLLDTSVISELIKPEPNANLLRWIDSANETTLFLSVLTLGEIPNGIQKLNPGKRRRKLQSWLEVDLRRRFQYRILTVTEQVAERWGALSATAAKKGRPVPVIDGLLAATAVHHDLTLVTRNDTDVSATGVLTLNPWR